MAVPSRATPKAAEVVSSTEGPSLAGAVMALGRSDLRPPRHAVSRIARTTSVATSAGFHSVLSCSGEVYGVHTPFEARRLFWSGVFFYELL